MTGRVTFRSPLAILASLSSTGLVAALVVGMWLYVWSRASGTDWLLVYSLPAVALTLLVLPFLQRFTIAPDGLVVTNLVARARIPWRDVAEVGVEPLRTDVLWRFTFRAPGIVVSKTNDLRLGAYATRGLRLGSRRRLAEAIAAAAAQHDFRSEVTAGALSWRAPREAEAPRDDALDDAGWDEDVDMVECVFCGRRASPDEMERLDQPSDSPAWYCRDDDVCAADERADRDQLNV